MSTVADITTKISAISAQIDVIAALVAELRANQGAATQAEVDAVDAALAELQSKALAIS